MAGESLAAFVDAVGVLARGGHLRAAEARAAERGDPLAEQLARAMIAATQNDQASLEAHARQAAALGPYEPLSAQAMCMAHLLSRRLPEAEHEARRALVLDDGPRSRRGLARVLLLQGRHADAERALRDLLARGDDAEARLMLAQVLARRGETFAALTEDARAFGAAPRGTALQQGFDHLRDAAWPLGMLVLARVGQAATSDPETRALTALVALRAARSLTGAALLAASDMRRDVLADLVALAQHLGAPTRMRVARELVDNDHLADAERLATAALPLGTSPAALAEAAYVRGLVCARRGHPSDALDAYVAAVGLDPGHWEAAAEGLHVALTLGGAALDQAATIVATVPVETRRQSPTLTLNEAIWLRTIGEPAEALLDWLDEIPGSPHAAAVRALRA